MENILSDEIISCVYTIQDTIAELIKIENKLAAHYGLTDFGDVQNRNRINLWILGQRDALNEDEWIDGVQLVRDWHEQYSSYANWIEDSPLYAKVYIHTGTYKGLVGRIISESSERIENKDGKWPYVINYKVRLDNGTVPEQLTISNREMIYL